MRGFFLKSKSPYFCDWTSTGVALGGRGPLVVEYHSFSVLLIHFTPASILARCGGRTEFLRNHPTQQESDIPSSTLDWFSTNGLTFGSSPVLSYYAGVGGHDGLKFIQEDLSWS